MPKIILAERKCPRCHGHSTSSLNGGLCTNCSQSWQIVKGVIAPK